MTRRGTIRNMGRVARELADIRRERARAKAEAGRQTTSELEQIARTVLGLETLETRHSDGLDFHDLAVWKIKEALQAAYNAGRASAK